MGKFAGINRNYSSTKENEGKSPDERRKENEELMKKFLAKGGKIQKIPSKVTKEMLRRGKL